LEDRSTLSVLESLSGNSDVNQRKIASQTGLNLAKVNFVLKKLAEKGFVKLQRVRDNPHKRRYLYLLTPTGMAEKSRLTYRFLQRTLRQYEEAEGKVRDCVESMLAQGVRRVALWGRTEITDLCERVLKKMDGQIKVVGVVDPTGRNPAYIHPSMLTSLSADAVLVCETDSNPPPTGITVWRLT
jgi:EPS-associated MarR family transcriptional regulator